MAVKPDRLADSVPYLIVLAAGLAALGQALLAVRYAAPFPISVSSGCMVSAVLLARAGRQWVVALCGIASIFGALAVCGLSAPMAASAAVLEVAVALVIRLALIRAGMANSDFASLKSFGIFFAVTAGVHVAIEAPLLYAIPRSVGIPVVPFQFVQIVIAHTLGTLIVTPWLLATFGQTLAKNEKPAESNLRIWSRSAVVAVLSLLIFKLVPTPIFPILTIIAFVALRLGASVAALSIVLVSGIATETFAFGYNPGTGAEVDSLSRNFILQQFIAACWAVTIPVAAAMADKVRLNAKFAESQQQLQTVLQSTGNIVFSTDASGRFTYLSQDWELLMGLPVATTIGRPAVEFMTESDSADSIERFKTVRKSGIGSWRLTRSFVRSDGKTSDLELTYRNQLAADGRLTGFYGTMRDITELRVVKAELERTRAELIHASRLSAMGALTSTIAHELNQPLLAVANFARGLKRILKSEAPTLSPLVAETLDDIDAGVLRAATIVSHMRSLVEKSSIRKDRHSLAEIVEDSRAIGLIDADSSGIECHTDLAQEADAVMVDPIQIQQVMVNLLRNAVDAMEGVAKPQIVIRSQAQGEWVEVQVSDKGHGLSEGSLANLFKPFDTTRMNGMGVGLSISRTIIEAHGGNIWADNLYPSGACFKFTLPRAPPL